MTWTLNYESGPADYITHGFNQVNPAISFWYYFFDTFLPTKGWTTSSSAHSSSQTYFLCKKEVTQFDGTLLKWCFIYEFEWSSNDLNIFTMPWTTNTPSTTDSISYIPISTDWRGWLGSGSGDFDGRRLQVWESDQDDTCFFVKTRDSGITSFFGLQLPDSWYYAKPNVVTGYDVSHPPAFLFASLLRVLYGTQPGAAQATMYSTFPPYYTLEMKNADYLSTYVQLGIGSSQYFCLVGSQNDMLWHRPGSERTWDITDWQAIGYKGKNYVDTGYTNATKGIMFDVGQVDPQTGV